MNNYMQADGWYFVFENHQNDGYPAIFSRVVMWHQTENGSIIGLISAYGTGFENLDETPNRLVTPPPVKGTYVHWNEMTDADREAALCQTRLSCLK